MKILAIDIGTAHIKSVIVETKFKRFDITFHDTTSVPDAWEPPLPDQLLTAGQLQVLGEIRNRYAAGVDRVVMNIPLSLYSSRFQTFPLKNKRQVMSAVKFAIEDEIPFDVENCIITSHLYPTKGKDTHVLTGFAPLPPLEAFIEQLAKVQLSPDALVMEDAALASQFARTKSEMPKNVAVLNIGHRRSGMYFFKDGLPVLHRNTMVGGYHVTHAISNRYRIGIAEAELAKTDRGFLAVPGMQLTPDQEAFSETIRESLEPVFTDFQQSLMAYSSRHNEQIGTIYLCGGSSLLPGLAEHLTHRWQKAVVPLQLNRLYPQFTIEPQRSIEMLLPLATALGLSQVPGDARSTINFRSGKLHAASRGLQLNFQQFVYPAKLALTIYIVAMLSVIGQIIFLNRELAYKDQAFNRALQGVLGRVSSSYLATLKATPEKMRQAINKKLEEAQSQVRGGGPTGSNSLAIIQELSKAVPPNAVMEIKQMEYQPTKLTLNVESPSQQDAERAINALTQFPLFVSPKASPLENGKGSSKKFRLTTNLNPKKGG